MYNLVIAIYKLLSAILPKKDYEDEWFFLRHSYVISYIFKHPVYLSNKDAISVVTPVATDGQTLK